MPDTLEMVEKVLDVADTVVDAFYDLPENVLNYLIASPNSGALLHKMEELDQRLFNLNLALDAEGADV